MGDTFSTGKSSARRQQRAARAEAAEQKKKEEMRLAEAESEVKSIEAAAKSPRAGRRSLIKSSPTGTAPTRSANLGGSM